MARGGRIENTAGVLATPTAEAETSSHDRQSVQRCRGKGGVGSAKDALYRTVCKHQLIIGCDLRPAGRVRGGALLPTPAIQGECTLSPV